MQQPAAERRPAARDSQVSDTSAAESIGVTSVSEPTSTNTSARVPAGSEATIEVIAGSAVSSQTDPGPMPPCSTTSTSSSSSAGRKSRIV